MRQNIANKSSKSKENKQNLGNFLRDLVSNHKVRVSNFLVQASNPLLVLPKKSSAAWGKKVRGLAQLIKYAFGTLTMDYGDITSQS